MTLNFFAISKVQTFEDHFFVGQNFLIKFEEKLPLQEVTNYKQVSKVIDPSKNQTNNHIFVDYPTCTRTFCRSGKICGPASDLLLIRPNDFMWALYFFFVRARYVETHVQLLYVWACYVYCETTFCVNTSCVSAVCEHSVCKHPVCKYLI